MRTRTSTLVCLVLLLAGCDSERPDPYALPQKSRNINELKQAAGDQTPEEIEAARKSMGFVDEEAVAAENAKMFEKGAREYVKTRLKEYREFNGEFRSILDEIEKQAPKWAEAKDPQKAFDAFGEKHIERAKKFVKTYDELTGDGAEGGNTQAVLGRAFRAYEELDGALGPDLAKQEAFKSTLDTIRKDLDEVEKALGEIEKDETLVVNETYSAKQKGKKDEEAKAEGGAEGEAAPE